MKTKNIFAWKNGFELRWNVITRNVTKLYNEMYIYIYIFHNDWKAPLKVWLTNGIKLTHSLRAHNVETSLLCVTFKIYYPATQ